MTKEALEQLKELNEKLIKLSDTLDRLIYSEMELIEKLKMVVESEKLKK
jgi:hypothetical protein